MNKGLEGRVGVGVGLEGRLWVGLEITAFEGILIVIRWLFDAYLKLI